MVRRVARAARPEAANPFESVLRAIALDVPGLSVEPQRVIHGRRVWARPDLVDEDLRIVLEADSFAWHGGREALDRDASRYNRLAVEGWLVLRFSWEAVMFRPDEVREVLLDAVAYVTQRTQRPPSAGLAA
jgi:very-short-patch-repair endonuclease